MQSCKSNLIVLFSHRHLLFSSHSRMGVAAVRTKDRGHYFYFTRILLGGDAGMAQWQESLPLTTRARFDSQTWRHIWVKFVVGSCSCSKVFSPGSPIFLPPQKPKLKFQFDLEMRTPSLNKVDYYYDYWGSQKINSCIQCLVLSQYINLKAWQQMVFFPKNGGSINASLLRSGIRELMNWHQEPISGTCFILACFNQVNKYDI